MLSQLKFHSNNTLAKPTNSVAPQAVHRWGFHGEQGNLERRTVCACHHLKKNDSFDFQWRDLTNSEENPPFFLGAQES